MYSKQWHARESANLHFSFLCAASSCQLPPVLLTFLLRICMYDYVIRENKRDTQVRTYSYTCIHTHTCEPVTSSHLHWKNPTTLVYAFTHGLAWAAPTAAVCVFFEQFVFMTWHRPSGRQQTLLWSQPPKLWKRWWVGGCWCWALETWNETCLRDWRRLAKSRAQLIHLHPRVHHIHKKMSEVSKDALRRQWNFRVGQR